VHYAELAMNDQLDAIWVDREIVAGYERMINQCVTALQTAPLTWFRNGLLGWALFDIWMLKSV
jgi:hypothetical protein